MRKKVIIIGAGVAGMCAAMELTKSGFEVEVFEAKKYAGGRCFSITDILTKDVIDNGQHVFVGAYKHFFELLKFIESENLIYTQNEMHIPFYHESGYFELKTGSLPGKLGLLQALLNFNMIDRKTKFAIIKLMLKMNFINPREIETAQELLERENQPESAVKCFWEPIILATMNQSVQKSSAKLFLNVIRKIFKNADGGKMIFSRVGLSELFTKFKQKIENSPNSKVHFESRISNIEHDGGRIKAVVTFDGERHEADYFISAMTPQSFARLMFAGGLDAGVQTEFDYSTIISCYIWTDKEMKTGEIAGLLDTQSDWIFDKRLISSTENPKYPYLYSITLSNAEHLANECHDKIVETLEADLRKVGLMKDGKVLHWRLLVDKRATISISAESESKRPKPETNFENLYIAGDWTSTELPATIEGAAQSGAEAAKIIIRKENPLQN